MMPHAPGPHGSHLPSTVGRYQIRDRLGQGGMGVLYLALDPAIDRLIALKLLRVNSAEMRERFVREAQIAARLQHPHIVTIYDVGSHEGQPFIAMEYIAGETMAELIQRRASSFGVSRRLKLMAEVCEGLAYAHKRQIIHRDVKPANLMVSRDTNAVKILDFGIARGTESVLTQAGMIVGSPNYMSPEQVRGGVIDHRSDIFAVGAVLYELLVYRQAFSDETRDGVLHKIQQATPQPVTELNSDLDPAVLQILDRALAKPVADRYQDLETMQHDLVRLAHRIESHSAGHTIVEVLTPGPSVRVVERAEVPRADKARLIERRAARMAAQMQTAEAALASGRLDDALAEAELAAELDPDHPPVIKLLDRVRAALDARDVARALDEIREHLQAGALTAAGAALARATKLAPGSPDVHEMRRQLDFAFEERERQRERARKADQAVAQARDRLQEGLFDAALRAVAEALGYDPTRADALALRREVHEAIQRGVDAAVTLADRDLASGNVTAAIERLERFVPKHERIAAALDRARQQLAERERRRREEEAERDRRRREEEEAARRALLEWAEARRDQVRQLLASRRWQDALDILHHVRERAPETRDLDALTAAATAGQAEDRREDDVQRHLARARQRAAAGDFAAALGSTDAALAVDPGHTQAARLRTEIDSTWAAAEIAKQEQEENARANDAIARARAVADQGRLADAIGDLERFSPAHPRVDETIAGWRTEHARREAARRAEEQGKRRLEQDQRIADALGRAHALASQEKLDAAIELLARFTPPDPRITDALARLREEIAEREHARPAVEEQRAREVIQRVQTMRAAGRLGEAIDELERFAPAHALVTQALTSLRADHAARAKAAVRDAEALLSRNQAAEAVALLERFSPPDPLVSEALVRVRTEIAAREARQQVDQAARRREIEEQERRKALDAWIARRLAEAQAALDKGQFEDAIAAAQRTLAHVPDCAPAARLIDLAVERQAARDAAAARAAQVQAYLQEARAQADCGDYAAALAHVESAAALDRTDASIAALRRDIEHKRAEAGGRAKRDAHDRRAAETVASAHAQFVSGAHQAALRRLVRFDPPHPTVREAYHELAAKLETIERERAEEEARAHQARIAQLREEEARAFATGVDDTVDDAEAEPDLARAFLEDAAAEEAAAALPLRPVATPVPVPSIDTTPPAARTPWTIGRFAQQRPVYFWMATAAIVLLAVLVPWLILRESPVQAGHMPSPPAAFAPIADRGALALPDDRRLADLLRPSETATPHAALTRDSTLLVDASPWARIIRIVDGDGREVDAGAGYTPLSLPVAAGTYTVTLEREGQRRSERITIGEREQKTARIEFEAVDAAEFFKN